MIAKRSLSRVLCVVAAALCFASAAAGFSRPAAAVLILDNMVFIGPKSGAATFKVKNTADRPEAYKLGWTQLAMEPGGQKEAVAPGQAIPGVMSADPYMFLSPRRLMLMPDQLQNIRFMVRRAQNMPAGEYRSYLVLQPEPVPKAFDGKAQQGTISPQSGRSGASVEMLSGYRVPVFFLNGETTLKVSIPQAQLLPTPSGNPEVHFTMVREGNRSALGDLTVNCTGGQKVKLGGSQIRIFTELASRNFAFKVKPPPADCGSIALDYLPQPLDPDYTGTVMRLAEVPVR